MQSPAIVAHMPPRAVETSLRHSTYIEVLAECLYETAALLNRLPDDAPTWDFADASTKGKFRFEAVGAVNRLDPAKRYEAQLRAREQVAAAHYGRDYSRLPGPLARKLKFMVQTAVESYSRCTEGIYSPLATNRAVELEPVEGDVS